MHEVYILNNVLTSAEYSGTETSLVFVFDTFEKAVNYLKETVKFMLDSEESAWLLDNECTLEDIKLNDIIRLFWRYQENWTDYDEWQIIKKEVK